MKRILVTGLKDPAGGVESAVMGYIRQFDPSVLQVDLAVFGEAFSCSAEIEARGGRVWYLPSRVRHPYAYKQALRAVFDGTQYDAVWCQFSGLTNIGFLKEAKRAGVLVRVAHAHTAAFAWGNPLMRYLVPVMHRRNMRVLRSFATHLWACSEAAARFMYGDTTATLIANAVDVKRFAFDTDVRLNVRKTYALGDAPVILHVGRMCTAKNQTFVLDVFKAVLQKRADAVLLFVGDGELHDAVHAYAEQIGVAHAVTFTGALDGTDAVVQAGDVFLLPSLTEGFPVTLVEAQAAGLPCVVSREAVPQSANVTQAVTFLSLDTPPERWAEAVLAVCGNRTADAADRVIGAGYDTAACAAKLQAFFTAKRIGMVTFPRAVNYGTALQALALQTVLEDAGVCAYFADHRCSKIADADKPFDLKRLTDVRYTVAHLLNFRTACKRNRRFAAFAERYMRFGPELPEAADVMVAGSDQIWNETITGGDAYYFLDFDRKDAKKTAYAASFGVSQLDEDARGRLAPLLSDFDCISVREQQAASLVQDMIGREVPVVPDPTLLLTAKRWRAYMTPRENERYIFVYTVFKSDSLWEFAERLSAQTGLPIRTVSYSVLHRHKAVYDFTASPADWLGYMAGAAYVVTNSFHGVAFSLNFHKRFFYELPPESTGVGSRLSNIVSRYGVEHRSIQTANTEEEIDFVQVEHRLEQDRTYATTYLRESIGL